MNQFEEAAAAYERALAIWPNFAEAAHGLGAALCDSGQVDRALVAYERAIALQPTNSAFQGNTAFARLYRVDVDPMASLNGLRQWDRLVAAPLKPASDTYVNDPDPNRPLRIGYVSPDFREHSVAYFLFGLLANHSPREFEVFCYSNLAKGDAVTEEIKRKCAQWRDVIGMDDEKLAALIRRDQIDLLIDLAGHTANNRLMVFARKPAPIQLTYLGYPGSTGLSAMDYRLTDNYLDPPGQTEQFNSEQLARLPRTFACYVPPEKAPAVSELPAKSRGFVTFGVFANLAKVTDHSLKVWAEILNQIPRSKLIMMGKGMSGESAAAHIKQKLSEAGISADRLTIAGTLKLEKYLQAHGDVDLLLDTFPVNGHTVTCHALWMGVPVVSLSGRTYCERLGTSVLSNLQLNELIARTPEQYVRIAVDLAKDFGRLAELRAGMRKRMARSPIMDHAGFARDVESLYRELWRKWVAPAISPSPGTPGEGRGEGS
jgi:predicted O-linked N-acetylglucosamine transferase (SPINDLY family)